MINGEHDPVQVAWLVEGEVHLRNLLLLHEQIGGYVSHPQMALLRAAREYLERKPCE